MRLLRVGDHSSVSVRFDTANATMPRSLRGWGTKAMALLLWRVTTHPLGGAGPSV